MVVFILACVLVSSALKKKWTLKKNEVLNLIISNFVEDFENILLPQCVNSVQLAGLVGRPSLVRLAGLAGHPRQQVQPGPGHQAQGRRRSLLPEAKHSGR